MIQQITGTAHLLKVLRINNGKIVSKTLIMQTMGHKSRRARKLKQISFIEGFYWSKWQVNVNCESPLRGKSQGSGFMNTFPTVHLAICAVRLFTRFCIKASLMRKGNLVVK